MLKRRLALLLLLLVPVLPGCRAMAAVGVVAGAVALELAIDDDYHDHGHHCCCRRCRH